MTDRTALAAVASEPSAFDAPTLDPAAFGAIAAILQREARIRLTPSKMTLVQSRLSRRLRQCRVASFADYVRLVGSNAEERATMVVALTTNHTHFFRENHHFDHFRETTMPWLEARARRQPIRIWSAGCSSGEEVYTIAMCLLGTQAGGTAWVRNGDVKLLASDLAPHVVAATTRASYAEAARGAIPEPYRGLWTRVVDGQCQIAEPARTLVTAKVLNLFEPWPMRRAYDVIFCRNVMIYFDDAAKAELEARFVDLLAPGGYLYIGHSERLAGSAAQRMQTCGNTIYRKSEAPE
jgi:chemotaxis protein methyltransferase CheR